MKRKKRGPNRGWMVLRLRGALQVLEELNVSPDLRRQVESAGMTTINLRFPEACSGQDS